MSSEEKKRKRSKSDKEGPSVSKKPSSKRAKAQENDDDDDIPISVKSPSKTVKKPRIPPPKENKAESDQDEDKEADEPDEEEESSGPVVVQTNLEGEKFIDLGKKKRATVRVFKGNVMVDIREFYGNDDDLKPGKKGITLNAEQWKVLSAGASTIDRVLSKMK